MQVDLTREEILLLISCTTYAAEQWMHCQVDGAIPRSSERFDAIVEKLQNSVNTPPQAANNP